jgi:hypothetical protein
VRRRWKGQRTLGCWNWSLRQSLQCQSQNRIIRSNDSARNGKQRDPSRPVQQREQQESFEHDRSNRRNTISREAFDSNQMDLFGVWVSELRLQNCLLLLRPYSKRRPKRTNMALQICGRFVLHLWYLDLRVLLCSQKLCLL